jgi:hypothetical protein
MRVFISYRREDTRDLAGRLADRLRLDAGIDSVFIDVETIGGGADFKADIQRALGQSNAVLVLIGKNWIGQSADKVRINEPDDFIRLEVSEALLSKARVIPVLANGAGMPAASKLPDDVRRITALNALSLQHETFARDADFLLDSILSRRPPTFWRKYWHRHPGQHRILRGVIGSIVTALLIVLGAAIHQRLTGLALNQSLGGTGPMIISVGVIVLLGTILPAIFLPSRTRSRS